MGSELRLGGDVLARTQKLRSAKTLWFWYGGGENTCGAPVATEVEAKAQAEAHIKNQIAKKVKP
jgi:hypothetical protein